MEHVRGKVREQVEFSCLEDLVERDSPARQIDRFVDESDTSYFSKSEVKETGRPPYEPKDILKLLIYGMDKGINTTRKLAKESRINVEVMWLINGLKPDSTTIRNFRRENAQNLTRFFNEFAKRLAREGLIDGKIVAVDGTKIRANNSKRNNFSSKKLDRHIEYIDNKLNEYINDVDKNDKIEELNERKARYEGFKERIESGEVTEVSVTDPDSRLMKQSNNGVDVAFNVQAVVDSKHKLIAGAMVTNEANDQGQLHKVLKDVKTNLEKEEMTVLADKGYYKTEDFKDCHEDNITTIVAKPEEKSSKTDITPKSEFKYDKENDCYYCPRGENLRFSYEDKKGNRHYKNSKACTNCPHKSKCTTTTRREISRHKYAEHAEQNDLAYAENYELYKQRQQLSEHPFGTVKRTMGIRQFQTRGLTNVTAEVALIFLTYNLKRLRVIHRNNTKNEALYLYIVYIIKIIVKYYQIYAFRFL